MKGIVVDSSGIKPKLIWEDVPDVRLGPDDVLVEVHATAVNRADLAQAHGAYPPPAGDSEILGLEMAGEVVSIGEKVDKWQPGDRVFSLLGGGGYAEKVAVNQGLLLPIPEQWSYQTAAGIPEAWLTAYVNLFIEGRLAAGESVLIHAGASGVGTAAIQLAKSYDCKVIATTSSQQKLMACREIGADFTVSYMEKGFFKKIEAINEIEGVDVILDPVGGSYLKGNVGLLNQFGRLISIGLLGGKMGNLDMDRLLQNRLSIIGSRLRNRPLEEKIEISQSFWARFGPYFFSDSLKPIIDTVIAIEKAQTAHDYIAQNRNIGKVVLAVR